MTIQEFIKKTLDDYSLPHDPTSVLNSIKDKARAQAKNGVAAIDDETVKDWILAYDPNEKPAVQPKAEKKHEPKTEWVKAKSGAVKIKEPPKEEKKEEQQNEQLSLFDLL